jgi:hypothetical protein
MVSHVVVINWGGARDARCKANVLSDVRNQRTRERQLGSPTREHVPPLPTLRNISSGQSGLLRCLLPVRLRAERKVGGEFTPQGSEIAIDYLTPLLRHEDAASGKAGRLQGRRTQVRSPKHRAGGGGIGRRGVAGPKVKCAGGVLGVAVSLEGLGLMSDEPVCHTGSCTP